MSIDASTFTSEPLVDVEKKVSKYPEVPADYPFTPIWQLSEAERAHIPSDQLEELELLSTVMVKLWSEGDRDFVSGHLSNETFYPKYPDVAYVKWDQYEEPDGTISRYVGRVLTTSDNDSDAIMEQLNNGKIPIEIRIIDYNSGGIDINEFLSK